MAPRHRSLGRNGDESFVDGEESSSLPPTAVSFVSSSSSSSDQVDHKPQHRQQQGGSASSSSFATTNKSRSPSPPALLNLTESDIARIRHDYFNLVALALMLMTIGLNYDYKNNFEFEYNGEYFWTMWGAVATYFVMDMAWVVQVPICVKSPHVIVKHHIAAMLYLVAPIAYPYLRWLMGVILSVEINTWFLICRRVVYKSNGSAIVSPVISYSVSALFYITWIAIRCYLYPRYMIIFLQMWFERYQQTGLIWHIEVIFIPVHAALCALNIKWSFDLFTPIIKRWMGTGPKQMVVQNGL